MLWPYGPLRLAVPTQVHNGEQGYGVLPSLSCQPAWVELALYLGAQFHTDWMHSKDAAILEERARYASDVQFYKESERYLYHLTSYFLQGWKRAGYAYLFAVASQNHTAHILDYGCGIGADGVYFLENGLRVSFADYAGRSTAYLAWRLQHRMQYASPIYDLEQDSLPQDCDIVWCMDVLEHLPPDVQHTLLDRLRALAPVVIMNLIDDRDADGFVHYPVDIEALTAYLEAQGRCMYQDLYFKPDGGKTRFVMFGEGTLRNGATIWGQPAMDTVHA